jgi:soluble lytic murein transglycosylase-like protein
MGKGTIVACLLVCTLLTACSSVARVPDTTSAASISTVTVNSYAPATESEVERAALTSRDRLVRVADDPQWSVVPKVADDATGLLEQLVTAERAVRDPAVNGAKLAYMGHLQQLAYRRLLERPELRDAVFAAIPPDLRGSADFNLAASADLWLFGPVRVTELPDWRIVSAPPINDLMRYYREAEAQFGVSWSYLAAINLVETRMGRIRGDSYAGAQGPMQFMPKTWDAYGDGDINDPRDAILGAARYLHATGAPADMERAIWHYNHDPEYVDAVMKYAAVMKGDPDAFRGYYGWQVYYQTANGVYLLPVGWSKN